VPTSPVQLSDFVFVSGRIDTRDRAVFVAHFRPALDKNVYISVVLEWEAGEWRRTAKFGWRAVDLEIDPRDGSAWILGRDGQIASVRGGSSQESRLEPERALGPMRGITDIGTHLFAFGMKRDMFRSNGDGGWQRFDAGMAFVPPPGADADDVIRARLADVGGISGAAGWPDEVYAVGNHGEIWTLNETQWMRLDSPTNIMLTAAASAATDVVAAGRAGIVIRGRGAAWEVVTYEGVQDLDFSSVACRASDVYLADGHSLRLLADGALGLVDFGVDAVVPSSRLDSADGAVLSVAGQEVFLSVEPGVWRSLLPLEVA
jgi:hypothetical protein